MAKAPFVDTKRAAKDENELMEVAEWFRDCLPIIRDTSNAAKGTNYRGAHIRFSGFGTQFAAFFPELSLSKVTAQLAEKQIACSVMGAGGPSYYLWDDKPESYRAEPTDQTALTEALRKKHEQMKALRLMESLRRPQLQSDIATSDNVGAEHSDAE
jgi:hypothetical protein